MHAPEAQADVNIAAILSLLDQAAYSLGKSFANYWPADDKNDPAERNVSLHVAHVMLSAGFSVFAEADHPCKHQLPILGIDLFALAPDNSWFVGCEFKSLYNIDRLLSLAADVDRLGSFAPRTEYRDRRFGPAYSSAISCCKSGYGVVGGLHWISGGRTSSPLLSLWTNPVGTANDGKYSIVADKLRQMQAVIAEPKVVIQFPTGNRYYLVTAIFPILFHPVEPPLP